MTTVSIPTGATPTLISAARKRNWVIIQNQSAVDVFFSFDGDTSITSGGGANPGFRISAGGDFSMNNDMSACGKLSKGFYAVHASGGTIKVQIEEA